MKFPNPTSLRVNAEGTIDGRWQIVLGRVVLSMVEDGQKYYWNEFYLADKEGRTSTLVFEETENGATWKIFTLFQPANPMTATEAAQARVGQKINVGGIEAHVTLVDESRVEFIEGSAPEGVELGDVARYFNARAEGWMIVVSWTGDEVEFYNGNDLPSGEVAKAFKISESAQVSSYRSTKTGGTFGISWGTVVGILCAVAFVGVNLTRCESRAKVSLVAPSPAKAAATGTVFPNGAKGTLHGWNVTVTGHALMEVRQRGRWFERHEYVLVTDDGKSLLLINNFQGVPTEWLLLFPKPVPAGFTAYKAAGFTANSLQYLRVNWQVNVRTLFRNDVVSSEATGARWLPGTAYGFFATDSRQAIFARWNEVDLQLFEGGAVPANDVQAAFAAAATSTVVGR